MSTDNASLKTVLSAAVVAAVISAAGIGLFAASQGPAPAPKAMTDTKMTKMPEPEAAKPAQPAKKPDSTAFTDAQKKSIEGVVRDYLMSHPEILIEMTSVLEKKQADARDQVLGAAIAQNAKEIYRAEDAIVAGNPNGDVTIVEFFDYNCGFCKRAFPALQKLIKADPNVRVVMKEFPIFGEQSVGAAKVAIAASKQGKHFEMHSALLEFRGRANEATALKVAEKLGLDMDKLRRDMALPEVQAVIDDTRALAEKLGVQGTPFYLVGDRAIPGAPENLYELFLEKVAEVRKDGCIAAC